MGADFALVIPENRKNDKKVIDDYYSFVLSKEKKFRPDIPKEKLPTNFNHKYNLDWLKEKGYILILERIYSDISSVLDWQRIYELFGGLYESDKTIIYGDKIKELIRLLREAEDKLVKSQKKGDLDWTDWEGTMETQVIALCEFALENNFGIRLSE
ncbi:hypothetical protein ANME2D_02866 [Candidatus Methanoperedens nitroreducens]|uniref:Uncharacterized protein n=1 Tax=Candidatus Methanoperedens nitratireducens TaxID=1392998 RepID=A0A062UUZ0_9EURY|nr:hypothetical protein [Candidatus Methanoperedens nitroreducens]KCZ70841.1 hypothetical protein ANME2D_02866 [Candidatus Methanoperedens nitroreducens]MDJ1420696.1 hypothetical protein [Candidatus Methanoperedens sp.]